MVLERWRPVRGLIPEEVFDEIEHRFEEALRQPFLPIEQVFDEMERRFEEALGKPFFPIALKRSPGVRAWAPPSEVIEEESEHIVKAEK